MAVHSMYVRFPYIMNQEAGNKVPMILLSIVMRSSYVHLRMYHHTLGKIGSSKSSPADNWFRYLLVFTLINFRLHQHILSCVRASNSKDGDHQVRKDYTPSQVLCGAEFDRDQIRIFTYFFLPGLLFPYSTVPLQMSIYLMSCSSGHHDVEISDKSTGQIDPIIFPFKERRAMRILPMCGRTAPPPQFRHVEDARCGHPTILERES